jgi:hypothetical protein
MSDSRKIGSKDQEPFKAARITKPLGRFGT